MKHYLTCQAIGGAVGLILRMKFLYNDRLSNAGKRTIASLLPLCRRFTGGNPAWHVPHDAQHRRQPLAAMAWA
jgi:hypothetical protein